MFHVWCLVPPFITKKNSQRPTKKLNARLISLCMCNIRLPPSLIPARFFRPTHLSFHPHEGFLVLPPSQLLPSYLSLFPRALGIFLPPSHVSIFPSALGSFPPTRGDDTLAADTIRLPPSQPQPNREEMCSGLPVENRPARLGLPHADRQEGIAVYFSRNEVRRPSISQLMCFIYRVSINTSYQVNCKRQHNNSTHVRQTMNDKKFRTCRLSQYLKV